MKKRKKLLIILPIFLIVFVAVAVIVIKVLKKPTSYSTSYSSHYILGGYCYGDDGVLYIEDNMLKFIDVESGNEAYVCSNINCEHESNEECQARVAGYNEACLMDDEYIYVLGTYSESEYKVQTVDLYRENRDGTNRKLLYTFENAGTVIEALLDDGVIYFYCMNGLMEDMNESGVAISKATYSVFGYYDLNTKEAVCECSECDYDMEEGTSMIYQIYYGQDRIYYCARQSLVDDTSMNDIVCCYDKNTGEHNILYEMSDDEIMTIISDEGAVIKNTKTKELTFYDYNNERVVIDTGKEYGVGFFDDGSIYYITYLGNGSAEWIKYDMSTLAKRSMGVIENLQYESCSGDYIWLCENEHDEYGGITATCKYRILKKDFVQGKFEERVKIFEKNME